MKQVEEFLEYLGANEVMKLKTVKLIILFLVGILFLSSPAQVYPVRFEESLGARRVREISVGNLINKGQISIFADDGTEFVFKLEIQPEDDRFFGERFIIRVYIDDAEIGLDCFRIIHSRRLAIGYESFVGGDAYYYFSHPDNESLTYDEWENGILGYSGGNGLNVEEVYRKKYRGIGKTLVGLAMRVAHYYGAECYKIRDARAVDFYKKLGFAIESGDGLGKNLVTNVSFDLMQDKILPALDISLR